MLFLSVHLLHIAYNQRMPVTVELKKLKILLKEQELILQKKSYEIAKLQLDLANKTSVHDAQEIILLKDKVKSLTKINQLSN